MKKLAVIADKENDITKAITQYFQNKDVKLELLTSVGSSNDYDLIASIHKKINLPNAINIHQSLFPSFADSENPILDAYMLGVKVIGITIHNNEGRIITQYPLLIGNLTHFDELENKIIDIEKKIYPIVIEKILNDEVFDFDDLWNKSNCHGCSKCNGCQ